jgi:hypothetical protein
MPAPITTASQLAGAELLELELLVALGLLLEPLVLELLLELLGAGALGTGGREAGCDLRGWGSGIKLPAQQAQLIPEPSGSADPEAAAACCP